ncbi:MAG TPA: Ig-like domain-containing protein [Firmicutes bacterium]|nr:Ig-like domain-containing protein [Bacillota bacterium]
MKHRIWSAAFGLAFAAILTVGLAACGDGTVAVESVTLDQNTLSLEVGKTETLTATVTPDNATDKTVTWTTDDAEVATVENGTVTAVAVGEAVITATAGDKTATCSVTVTPAVVAADGITLNVSALSLEVGKTGTLTATVTPDNATDKTVTWTTDNAEVATVENGTVTAVAVGETVITAKAGDKTATCSIVVANKVLSTAEDLTAFATAVNGGNKYEGKTVALGADIDLTDTAWTPIGAYYYGEGTDRAFSGTFNGNGYAVKGIEWNNVGETAENEGGLFGYLANATVKNVTVEANIETSGWAGILAGRAEVSRIIGVTTKGSILGDGASASVAGLCEYMYGSTATDCVNEATVTSKNVSANSPYAAGISNEVNGSTIENCVNRGAVTLEAPVENKWSICVGGIAAYMKNGSTLSGNTNTAAITVTEGAYCEVGGIVGDVFSESEGENKVIGNTNNGTVSATSNDVYVGGIVGAAYAIYSVKIDELSYEYYNNTVTFTGNTNSGEVIMTPAAEDENGWGYTPCAGGLIGWLEQYSEESFVDDGTNKSSVTPENMTEGRGDVKNDYGKQVIDFPESNE